MPSSKSRYILKNITLLLPFTVSAFSAQAADQTEESVYQLGQIVVNDSRPAIGTSYSVDREQIDSLGARSLDEAVRMSPSINVRNGADGTPRLDIRGLRTRQIKLLVNGVPYNSTFDGQFDPTLIPSFAIGRIDLQAGNSSVLYGDGGMGGVMNIQTRGVVNGFKAGTNLEMGSDQYWHTNAFAGYGDETNDFFFSLGKRQRDSFPMSADFESTLSNTADNYQNDQHRENTDNRRTNFVTSYNRQVTEQLNLGFFISHVQGDYGKPPIVFDNKTDDFANKAKYERSENQIGTTVQVGGEYEFNQALKASLWLFNNQFSEDNLGYDDSNYNSFNVKNSFSQTDKTQIRGFHAQLNGTIESSNTEVGLSIDKRNEAYESNGFNCGKSKCTKTSDYDTISADRDVDVRSVGLEIIQPLPWDLNLVLGAGHHELNKETGNDDSANSLQLALSEQLSNNTSVYASYGHKVDAPTIRQLYDTNGGNSELGFQRAKHTEVGLKNQWNRGSLNVALYHSRILDYIERDSNNEYMNRQELLFRGVDVMGAWQASDALTLRAAAGILIATDESNDATSSKLQYRPHEKVTLQADYDITTQWRLNTNLQYIGQQAYFNRIENPAKRTNPADYQQLNSFTLVGAKLSYAFDNQRGNVYVGVDNLFDRDYSTSYGFPQAGRFIYTGVNLFMQ